MHYPLSILHTSINGCPESFQSDPPERFIRRVDVFGQALVPFLLPVSRIPILVSPVSETIEPNIGEKFDTKRCLSFRVNVDNSSLQAARDSRIRLLVYLPHHAPEMRLNIMHGKSRTFRTRKWS
jgi:hypothetical protein